jgi:hypothetical protein
VVRCQAIAAFVHQWFADAGSDVLSWSPPDFNPTPPLLDTIVNGTLRQWASDVNGLWKLLGKQVPSRVSVYVSVYVSVSDPTTPLRHNATIPQQLMVYLVVAVHRGRWRRMFMPTHSDTRCCHCRIR